MRFSSSKLPAAGRSMVLAGFFAIALIAAGCGSNDDEPAPVGNDTATPAPGAGTPTTPAPGAGTPTTPAPVGGGVSTSRFCDEGTGGTLPAQPGDPAVDTVADAQPGAAIVTASAVSCRVVEGSLDAVGTAETRDLTMDRANLAFSVDGAAVVSGADAFRWVDSREYCAKPAPVTLANGDVRELVAKFTPDTNRPSYYREKLSKGDGTFVNQIECFTGVEVNPAPVPTPAT